MGNQVSIWRVPIASLLAPLEPERATAFGSDDSSAPALSEGESVGDYLARLLEVGAVIDETQIERLPGATAFEGWDFGASEARAVLGRLAERGGPSLRFLRFAPARPDWAAHLARLPPGLERLARNPSVICLEATEVESLRAAAAEAPDQEGATAFPNLDRAPNAGSVDLLYLFGEEGPPLNVESLPESSPERPWPAASPSRRSATPGVGPASFQRAAVALLVFAIAFAVPGVVYFYADPRFFLIWAGLLTFFWLLFSLVAFQGPGGEVVPWPKRAALLVGGELLMAGVMLLVHRL